MFQTDIFWSTETNLYAYTLFQMLLCAQLDRQVRLVNAASGIQEDVITIGDEGNGAITGLDLVSKQVACCHLRC